MPTQRAICCALATPILGAGNCALFLIVLLRGMLCSTLFSRASAPNF